MASSIISLQLLFCVKFTSARFWWLSTKFRKQMQTRKHSSRMRTARLLTLSQHAFGRWVYRRMHVCVYPSMHWAGGVSPWGVSARGDVYPNMHWAGGVYPGGVSTRGCLARKCVWQTPPLWTEWQTGVKTLPCRNFVAGGKKWETNRRARLEMPPFLICNHYG